MLYQELLSSNKIKSFIAVVVFLLSSNKTDAQAEVEAWGNVQGIRVEGELMKLSSSLDVINSDWKGGSATAKERQRPTYKRNGNIQTVSTRIDSFYLVQQVEDIDKGIAKIKIQLSSKKDASLAGAFFHLRLPMIEYGKGKIESLINQQKSIVYSLTTLDKEQSIKTKEIKFLSASRQLKISFDSEMAMLVKKRVSKSESCFDVFIPIMEGSSRNNETHEIGFVVQVSGNINKSPVTIQLSKADPGAVFAGFGGNFRLQNPRTDPQVIDYCLNNMRVAWGRVEMPWQLWQQVKDSNPIDSAKAGHLNDHVKKSMEMAARLYKKGMPVILTAWSAPQWAVVGAIGNGPRANGVWGNPLDTNNTKEIYQSIADYIIYLKDAYGVEIALFSFNESDLGINIRQTGEEHAVLIKGLGAYFLSRGLKTKMLLGDNSDANSYAFIYPAMKDAATHPYIGAVSFHSWRGCDTATLLKWKDAASQMKLPLLVGEGSIDAAAWNYPSIFDEQVYSMEEIELYVRMMAVCEPMSILQWQLTADYSPLAGGGIFGDNSPLRPLRRFWNLKQLSSIPENLNAIPLTVSGPFITGAAQGSTVNNHFAVHLVNNGASRWVTLKGLPVKIKQLQVFVTGKLKNMQEEKVVNVLNGQAKLLLDEVSYTTLISK